MRPDRLAIPSLFFTFLLGSFIALALTGPRDAAAKIFDPETFTLDNGLQVVVVSNRRAPIVTHMIWYKVGAADEPPGKSGIAHFLEHLMFKGTETLGPGEFSEIIARNGGQENAFTSWDYTGYYQTIAKDRLETVMRYEADRMANLRLTDEVADPERLVILEERRSRIDNNPGSQLSEMVNASLFLNHPYGTPIIGWEQEIRSLTTEDAIRFYQERYAPNNAVLVVAGDVSAKEVRPLAEKYYGVVPSRAVPERIRPQEPVQTAPRRVTLESPRVRQPSLSIEFLAPSFNAKGDDAYSLQILDEIIGGGATSRLYKRLVVEQSVAASAGSQYSGSALDLATFTFYVSPRPGLELDKAEAALRAEIEQLLAEGVTAEEVARSKKRLLAASIYARDNLSTGANIFGRALTTGRSVEDVESWPDRIEAVTADKVNATIRTLLRYESSVTAVLVPEPTS